MSSGPVDPSHSARPATTWAQEMNRGEFCNRPM